MKHIQKSLLLERNLAGGLEGGAGSAESSSVTPQEVLDKEFYNSLTKESQKALSRVLKGSQIQKIKNGEQAVRLNSVLKMGFIPERKAVVQEAKVAQQDHRSEVGEAKVVTLSDNDNASYESSEVQSGNVEALQTLIGTKVDGDWGANSQRALNTYLKKGKNAVKDVQRIIGTKADGAWGPNSRAQLTAFIDGGSAEGGHSELGKEVITQLKDIQEYLDAYNRVYGEQKEDGKVKLFSNNKGLLGIANQVVSPNYKKLAGELGVTNNQVQEITGDKGINKAGLTRFATIAVVSAFVSGGSSVALELFGINV